MSPEHPRRETPADFAARIFGPPENPYTIEDVDFNGNPIQPNQELKTDLDLTPDTPRSRFWQFGRYGGRTALAGALLVAGGAVMLHEEPSHAESTQAVAESFVPHTVYRTGGDGVWLHESPGLSTSLKVVMPEGSQFNVDCFVTGGDNVNGNRLWLQGEYNGQTGAVTDYYIDTHWNTTQDLVNQGVEECGTQPAAAPAPEQHIQGGDINGEDLQNSGSIPEGSYAPVPAGCYFNFKWPKTDLTFSYEGDHRYYGNAWQAAKNWTDLDAGMSIKPAPEGQEGDIVIEDVSVVSDEDGTWLGKVALTDEQEKNTKLIQQDPELVNEMRLLANKHYLEGLSDYQKTYMFTHEIGHVLGLAHFDDATCNIANPTDTQTIMVSGGAYRA